MFSGKTSLVKALSTSLSTAALDKNPQSQRRGITLDLGFSSFSMDMPSHLQSALPQDEEYDQLQFTLVDCPGHASLIRTIIGGAQIIDMIVLVIDINKGIQTQTAECIVIGEITTDSLIIVLNKVDMIPPEERNEKIEKMSRRIRKIFSLTKFHDPIIIATSAMIGGEKVAAINSSGGSGSGSGNKGKKEKKEKTLNSEDQAAVSTSLGIDELLQAIRNNLVLPKRNFRGPFHFSIDHCFAIKGHGTVLTGTILSGMVSLNQTIELPELQLQRKVKSMQMFHKPVKSAKQGDRVGICVTNLDPTLIERGIATSIPTPMIYASNLICLVRKVRFFKQQCKSGSLFHVSIGHQTVTATVYFFGREELAKTIHLETEKHQDDDGTGSNRDSTANTSGVVSGLHQTSFPDVEFNWDIDYEYQEELIAGAFQRDEEGHTTTSSNAFSFDYQETHSPLQWMSLQLHTPVYCTLGSLIIASKLDSNDISASSTSSSSSSTTSSGHPSHSNDSAQGNANSSCRLAFYGPIKNIIPQQSHSEYTSKGSGGDKSAHKLKLYRWKQRECEIQRLIDCRPMTSQDTNSSSSGNINICYEAIAWKLYHKNATIKPFLGLKLMNEAGEAIGIIHGPFGASDKFRVKFPHGVLENSIPVGTKLYLKTKKYFFEKSKTLLQNGIEIEGNDLRQEAIDASLVSESSSTMKGEEEMKLAPSAIENQEINSNNGILKAEKQPEVFCDSEPMKLQESKSLPAPSPSPPPPSLQYSPTLTTPSKPPSTKPVKASNEISSSSTPSPSYQLNPLNLASIGMKKAPTANKNPNSKSIEPTSNPTPLPGPSTISASLPSSLIPVTQQEPSPSPAPLIPPLVATTPTVALSNCNSGTVRVGTIESIKSAEPSSSSSSSSSSLSDFIAIVVGCFRMEENIRLYVGSNSLCVILTPSGAQLPAQLTGPFAKLGKCKVQFSSPVTLRGEELVGCKVEIRIVSV